MVRSLAADELAAYAALDIGGSGVRLEIYATNGIAINRYAFPLGTPVETLECVLSTLISRCVKDAPVPLGVASFGPIDLDPVSSTFGNITTTPKTWWQGFPLRSYLQTVYTGPVCIWIDNNCSALAEASARNLELDKVLVFIGVGTGFGAAAIRGRTPLLLNGHSEFGHMYVRRYPTDMFSGSCPFHGDCLEGLASGSAIIARQKAGYGTNVSLVAHYLAQASYTLTLMLAPSIVVLGGGVPFGLGFLDEVRAQYDSLWGGYLDLQKRAPLDLALTTLDSALVGASYLAKFMLA